MKGTFETIYSAPIQKTGDAREPYAPPVPPPLHLQSHNMGGFTAQTNKSQINAS